MAGLYVHIPFCKKKCAYCDFVSFAGLGQGAVEDYIKALLGEMELSSGELPKLSYDSVFIGGGTPSILPPFAVSRVLEGLQKYFSIRPEAEISMESNPGTLSLDKLREYRAAGVNRLSLGLQSTKERLLKRIGRIHSYGDFLESLDMARRAGFININADLMYGLPGQRPEEHEDSLRAVCALELPHISAYSLILEEGTPLFAAHPDLPDEEESYVMHRLTIHHLQSRGYERYEISNYAKPGMACRHNLNYWENGQYLGLGLGSHSAMRIGGEWRRFCNSADMGAYLEGVGAGRRPVLEDAAIPPKEEMFECVMLGLRKTAGIEKASFAARFGQSLAQTYGPAIARAKSSGWLLETQRALRLTDRGMDLQNQVLLLFL